MGKKGLKKQFVPMFYENPSKEQVILTLGLNPSLTTEFKSELNARGLELELFEKASTAEQNKKITDTINYQKELKYGDDSIQYFNLQKRFFEDIGVDMEKNVFHYDLYQNRETNSKNVIKDLKNDKDLTTELIRQLKEVIVLVNPKLILVFNASVSKILKDSDVFFDNIHLELDPEKGCYYYYETPLVLANQLSGGATSIVYRDILVWLTKRILKKTK
ncbi:MAG: hypothetical protein HOI49_08280 [Bacteroidetes bacterium]|nr:hypothetical protein [Bacteroidota bacterium]